MKWWWRRERKGKERKREVEEVEEAWEARVEKKVDAFDCFLLRNSPFYCASFTNPVPWMPRRFEWTASADLRAWNR